MTGEFGIAVHAIVYLNHRKKTLSSDTVAQNVCTNPARVRKIMSKLKKAGLVYTKEGLEGGYSLDKDSSNINLRQISEALDINFVSSSWKSGNQSMECMICSGMADVMDNLYEELNEICKKRLEKITIDDINNKIFKNID